MKKAYVTPTVEKVEFQYDKVVAASGCGTFVGRNDNDDDGNCDGGNQVIEVLR